MRKIWLISIIAIVMLISTASALPEILDIFNKKYNTAGTELDTCDTCHIPVKPQRPVCGEVCHIPNKPQKEQYSLNSYGIDLKNNLNHIGISQALSIIEPLDSDKDKYSNIDEINNLTFPGEKKDFPAGKRKDKNKFSISPVDIINYSDINNYSPP